MDYNQFFKEITKVEPYPYQIKFAESDNLYSIVDMFAGAGKTETVVLGWVWKKFFNKKEMPRKLIYCLPMRSLVEQTYQRIKGYLDIINKIYNLDIEVYKVLGGDFDESWDIYPEKNCIIIGTQDMLLSRALNRGYGINRFREPLDFGFLNNDTIWVFDEIQLMGDALKTSTQLQGLRDLLGTIGITQSIWMSATLSFKSLESVDYKPNSDILKISGEDLDNIRLKDIYNAKKSLKKIKMNIDDSDSLAKFILDKHTDNTIVIMNRVSKAVNLYKSIKNLISKNEGTELLLIHSHFRPKEREEIMKKLDKISNRNRIIISTQVIEAGIDISSRLMFSEIAPISSIIQRAGRCNRKGEYNRDSNAEFYIILPEDITKYKYEPYDKDDINRSISELNEINDLKSLKNIDEYKYNFVLRKKDIIDLFNSDISLTGDDIDISRFIRSGNDINAFVFWRDLSTDFKNQPQPSKDELCPAPLSDLRNLLKTENLYMYNWLDGEWKLIPKYDENRIIPGNEYMLDPNSEFSHYSNEYGWDIKSKTRIILIEQKQKIKFGYSYDESSFKEWKSISKHTDEVVDKTSNIINDINISDLYKYENDIINAAIWHDSGKAHPEFQGKINQKEAPLSIKNFVAKAPSNMWGNPNRRYFRHELASGIMALENGQNDLVAYLAVSHHGKIRISIRSLPKEKIPPNPNTTHFACGVWDGDIIPEFLLSDKRKLIIKSTKINLSYMELGNTKIGESWDYRVSKLYDEVGIFKLGYMENILRSADQRASGGLK